MTEEVYREGRFYFHVTFNVKDVAKESCCMELVYLSSPADGGSPWPN